MMQLPNIQTLQLSAVSYLRDIHATEEADLLARCKMEIGTSGQRYINTTTVGLNITLRCKATDVEKFIDRDFGFDTPSSSHILIQQAIEYVLPVEFKVHAISARSLLVGRNEFDKTELERAIETQKDVMVAVATGGPRIESKNAEYKERRILIREKLEQAGKSDPNPFDDLWAWYGRWRSGDLPSYQSRREYIQNLYQPTLEELAGADKRNPSEPRNEPTGWVKVDRTVDKIIAQVARATCEEEYQTVGFLCRECLISLAQSVYNPDQHRTTDGVNPSETDAYRMLEAYFSAEYAGSNNEALRRHAKASLSLANELQHKRTAQYKDAALCSEATRTVINIVAISSGKR